MADLRRFFPRAYALVLFSAFQVAVGCKSTNTEQDTKSLDNFARSGSEDWQKNTCGEGTPEVDAADVALIDTLINGLPGADVGEQFVVFGDPANPDETPLSKAAQDAAKTALRQSLRSVPSVILGGFFAAGGRIVVPSNVKLICSSAHANRADPLVHKFESEGNRDVTACIRERISTVGSGNDAQQVMTTLLYISPEPTKITHALVRGMALAISEQLTYTDFDATAQAVVKNPKGDAELEAAQNEMVQSLLADTIGSARFNLDLYKDELSTVLAETTVQGRSLAWERLVEQKPAFGVHFKHFVFAESFDSYYCSGATRASMAANFPKAFATFKGFADQIETLKSDLPEVDEAQQLDQLAAASGAQSGAGTQGFNLQAEASAAVTSGEVPSAPAAVAGVVAVAISEGLSLRRIAPLRGVGRAIRGVAYGAGRVVVGAGRVVVGAGRVVGRAAVGVVRIAGTVVRGAARVTMGVIRGTGRVVGRVVRGAAIVAGGVVRGAGHVLGWTIRSTGYVVRGFFGGFAYMAGCRGLFCGGMRLTASDLDGDGIPDDLDQCANTGKAAVHKTGIYAGCGAGQIVDSTLAAQLQRTGYEGTADHDEDGIINDLDQCSGTPKGATVHKSGEWAGCSAGQKRDGDMLAALQGFQQ